MRVFNFAAGPATLPLEVLEQAQSEMTNWKNSGMSVMEVSHRSKAFIAVAQEAEADLRELLNVPANYKVLFLQGGATGMFSAIPMNLTTADSTVDYVNTGAWSKKAIGEAKRFCKVNVAAAAAASHHSTAPPQGALKPPPPRRGPPAVWAFKAMPDEGSRLNTPPTFGWYFAGLVFKWLKKQGGLKAIE